MTTSRPSTDAGRMLDEERRHHNDAYRREFAGLRHDNWLTFRDSVTPAHLPGGTIGGLKGRRAYEILLGEGLAGKRVLDYACGLGKWSVHLAQSGAHVSGFDVSDVAIELARERAAFNDLAIR